MLSEDVVAIDTWHDARWRQSPFAFIQMIAALSLFPSISLSLALSLSFSLYLSFCLS